MLCETVSRCGGAHVRPGLFCLVMHSVFLTDGPNKKKEDEFWQTLQWMASDHTAQWALPQHVAQTVAWKRAAIAPLLSLPKGPAS